MEDMICRAKTNGTYDSVSVSGVTLEQQIQNDVKFGFLKPTNGLLKYFIHNFDGEISEKNTRRAVGMALFGWRIRVPIKFRRVKDWIDADITIRFSSEDEDDILDKNTLAYMFYPLGGINDGKCVVNTRFFWTNDGKGVDMHKIDPMHYPHASNSNPIGKTYDLDQVLRHEFGHGVFGLPHSHKDNVVMTGNESRMHEHLQDEDVIRAQAKAGINNSMSHRLLQMLGWYEKRSD
jgi:hypothetical protein